MLLEQQVTIPSLVRIKPGCLANLGRYLSERNIISVALLYSEGLNSELVLQAERDLGQLDIVVHTAAVSSNAFELATAQFSALPSGCEAVLGLGGGRALDVAKYVAFLARLPYFAMPTSLSNDGFCSPQSSLQVNGRRKSLPSAMPYAVLVDTAVCLGAPRELWLSGVGDLVAKLTAVTDWKLAFHKRKTPVNDFAALLSDATVFQFLARPTHDLDGLRLMATALMLNGVAMAVCGSSRPASGSEHLISHALDELSARPRLHGLQVGAATYVCAHLQNRHLTELRGVFSATGFFDALRADPFSREEFLQAVRRAPGMRFNYYTVLSERDTLPEVAALLDHDPLLKGCFV